MSLLELIRARINLLGDVNDPRTPRPLLTLSEFFEGNETVGSIGCNLVPTPTPRDFYLALQGIASRHDVADVRVQIAMADDSEWPFSDTVWIITSRSATEVSQWFEELIRPDKCFVGWPEDIAIDRCTVPQGMQPVACWWD